MNPQQYYQYQMAVTGVQGMPVPPTYLTNPAVAGGTYLPPPSANIALVSQTSIVPPKVPVSHGSETSNKTEASETGDCNINDSQSSSDAGATVSDKLSESNIASVSQFQSSAGTTSVAIRTTAVPTPVSVQPPPQASLMSGAFAGTYNIPQAIPQPPSTLAPTQPQYVMTPAGLQRCLSPSQGSKLLYLPQNYIGGVPSNTLYQPGGLVQPTVVTDHTGKVYIVNGAYQPQLQYPSASSGGFKSAGQQYFISSPQYYGAMQPHASAALSPTMYGRYPSVAPTGQSMATLSAVPGVPHTPAGASQSPQVYYYYP